MRHLIAVAALFILVSGFDISVGAAPRCPVSTAAADKAGGYAKAVLNLLRNAPTCEDSYKALAACQFGSSADNAFADIVQSKCEPLFLPDAVPATRKAYKQTLARCDKIAENSEGSIYQGVAAVCRAKAAWDFAIK